MKIRRIKIENARSFLEPEELLLDGDISIVIGPNGGGKTNLLDIAALVIRRFILTSWIRRHTPSAENPNLYHFQEMKLLALQ
jgi:predicted ATP-binding protein involved in virulence